MLNLGEFSENIRVDIADGDRERHLVAGVGDNLRAFVAGRFESNQVRMEDSLFVADVARRKYTGVHKC